MKKVIVMGGSAGGIQALRSVLTLLPKKLSAAVLVVIHVSERESILSEVLQRSTKLKVITPAKPEPIHAGCVYVAPSNRHLIVRGGCAVATMGPRENRHRPSIDPLFRSAARAYRRNLIGVILSGALDDGTAGALSVRSRGGEVIVQDPVEAQVADMPANVIRQIPSVRRLKAAQIARTLSHMVSSGKNGTVTELTQEECQNADEAGGIAKDNEPIALTCPDCGGALLRIQDKNGSQFRCHVGHRFSLDSFNGAHADAVERAIWVALRKLKEQRSLHEQLSREEPGPMKKRYQENAAAASHDIRLLEEVLSRL